MSDPRHRMISELFLAARDVPSPEREIFVRSRANGDEAVIRRVLEMLAADETTNALLSDDVIDSGSHFGGVLGDDQNSPPKQISRFKVIREIGRGGMGVVYEAQQVSPARSVAIKVIRSGMSTPQSRARFEREAELLGRLQHPGIAQIYEAGSIRGSEGGQPFIAMELVDGVPIKEYCDAHELSTHERLGLIAKIGDALQHAHQKGVIHRDLKPENILVVQAEPPQPKILDFGVARVSEHDSLAPITVQDQIIGTLDYMSPEQVSGTDYIDIRTDIYALGVLAFELLTGERPFDLSGLPIVAAARIIEQDEPKKPSTISPVLRGDIETMIAKAMSRDMQDRYQSAAEFSADIGRYQRGEPILAHPPSTRYQMYKFASRNKALVLVSSCAVVLLIGALIFTSIALGRARAKTRLSDALYEFMTVEMLEQADPNLNEEGNPTIRMVLDRASERLDTQFEDDPEIELRLRETMRRAYASLRLPDQAAKHSERVVEIASEIYGPLDTRTMSAKHSLSSLYIDLNRLDEAMEICKQVLAHQRKHNGPEHPETLQIMNNLGACLLRLGRLTEASPIMEETLRLKMVVIGPDDPSTLTTKQNLAGVKLQLGEHEDAQRLFGEVADQRARLLGDSHPSTAASRYARVYTLLKMEQHKEAQSAAQNAIEALGERLEDIHPTRLSLEIALFDSISKSGEPHRAWTLAQTAAPRFRLNEQQYQTWVRFCAPIAHDAGDHASAIRLYEEYFDRFLHLEPPQTGARLYQGYAQALLASDDSSSAIEALQNALELIKGQEEFNEQQEDIEAQIKSLQS